ncbi:MAG: peptide/nickel transport system permease protein [Planctomycetota bacterium]|jgi:peptide/nickel transport system permease protein
MSAEQNAVAKFWNGRGMRKLRRDRMAMLSLSVIGLYLVLGLAVAFGLIDEDDVFERSGPDEIAGAWGHQDGEKRLSDAEFYIESVERAARSSRPEEALTELSFGHLRPVPGSPEEVQKLVDQAWISFDAVAEYEELDDDPEVVKLLATLEADVAALYPPPAGFEGLLQSFRTSLGTDRQGRSIMLRALYSAKVAIQIGIVAALFSVLLGTFLGAAAGYFGGWVDHAVVWLYSTFSSIPWIVLLMVLASMFRGGPFDGTLVPIYAAFCMSFWISPCRIIRGEVMKLKELEYVQAASAIGFSRLRILIKHIIPNTVHLMFINFSLLFIGAIKAEVILSFLGLGVKNEPSWGVMINHAKAEVLNGFFWQIGAATFFMLILVLAFNILSDALQDAFDPKHVS